MCFLSECTCFFIVRCVKSTRTNPSCTLIFFLPMYPMSSSCFDMISDKGGGRHGHHVCMRSVLGSLLLLLTLTLPHRRQGRAGQLPRGGGGRAEARGGGKGGGGTGFPPGDALRDEEVGMLHRSSRRQTRVRDGQSLGQRRERQRLPLLLLLLRGRRCQHAPSAACAAPGEERGADRLLNKKYLVKKIIVMTILHPYNK